MRRFGSSGTGKVVGPRYLGVGHNLGRAIAVQPGGKIVAVGSYLNTCTPGASSSWGIARYRPDGSLDPTFGSGGLVLVTFAGGAGAIAAVVVQPADGKVVVVGSALPKKSGSAQSQAVVVRLNPNGSLDSTFGSGGVAWVPPTSGGMLEAVVLQSDGKIVAAGVTAIPPYLAFLSRLSANGTLDTTFNGTGTVLRFGVCPLPSADRANTRGAGVHRGGRVCTRRPQSPDWSGLAVRPERTSG